MRNIFHEKHKQNVVKKMLLDRSLENQNWEYLDW